MKELALTAEIIFLEIAEKSFRFPVTNYIRLSFWLPGDKVSTFSEVQPQGVSINIGGITIVKVGIVERDFLVDRIKVGTQFRVGVYPQEIAIGKVIEVVYD